MTKVALLKVEDYREEKVREAIAEAFLLLGLKEDFFAGQQVLLKPNLLTFSAADGVVCTHPSIIKGMASLAREKGGQVTAGDSPGFGSVARVAASCGLKNVLVELNIPLLSFEEKVEVKFPPGQVCKSFFLGQPLTEGKKLVSLARLKTHGLTRYTGAVKNLYGCIAGKHKGALHLRYQKIDDFSKMLADLLGLLQPALSLVDGIVSMEGSGPRSGTPRQTGFIVMSEDAVAADVVACTLVGIDPGQVLHLKFAAEMGWGEADFSQLELVGDSPDNLRVSGFKQATGSENTIGILPPFLIRLLRDFFISLPYVKLETCTGCGVCAKTCPPGIITIKDKKACIEHASCIRCYCCQELCPHEALELKRKWHFKSVSQ